jgi:hypothetical protein
VGNLWVVALALAFAASLAVGCGGGGGEIDLSDADAVMAGALRAMSPPGKVGHLKWVVSAVGVETPLAEAWIDADNGRFRVEHRSAEGEEGSFTVGVGEDWRTAAYETSGDDSRPFSYIRAVDREEWDAKGIDNFAYFGGPYPGLLVQAEERRVVGESTSDGRQVVVVEGKQAMDGDWEPGTMFVTTAELDKVTLLPVQFRSSTVQPDGTETGGQSLAQFEWEALSPDDLPADFFSPDALFAEYSTAREELTEASKLGFDLYWLGAKYKGAAGGQLDLYLWDVDWDVDADPEDWPQLHYASETMRGPEAVIIREGPAGRAQFGPPREMSGPNAGPIEWEQVTVLDQPATLYSRTDNFSPTYEVTYRWLVVTLGETAIELYPVPMSEDGQEMNPLNDTEALVALAEDLAPVPDEP